MAEANTTAAKAGTKPARRKGAAARRSSPSQEACLEYAARLGERDVRLVQRALKVLEKRAFYPGAGLSNPRVVRDFLRFRFAGLEHEEFRAIWLNAQNHLIADDRLSLGSLTQTSVYPREVVKAGLAHNAAAVIFSHNHPSGVSEPSAADELLTRNLKDALALVDIKVLDHFIVGAGVPLSFAERGLL